MKKNFQLFIFFLFTLLSGFLVYMGNEILIRLSEVEAKVGEFQKDVNNLKGAVNVIKNFNNTEILKKAEAPAFPDENLEKVKSIKPIEGFYCEVTGEETAILELLPNNKIDFWDYRNDAGVKFDRSIEPTSKGSYFIKGGHIYVTVKINDVTQNRKISVLKVDSKGYATQLEGFGRFFTNESCPKDVLLSY